MNTRYASSDPGRYVADYGREVETIRCFDETDLVTEDVLEGMLRAEEERMNASAALFSDPIVV